MNPLPLILLVLVVALGILAWRLRRRVLLLQDILRTLEREKKAIYTFLDRFGTSVTQGTEIEKTMEVIVEFAMEATKADAACLFVRDPGAKSLKARVVRGLFPPLHRPSTEKLFSKHKFVAEFVKKAVIDEGDGVIGQVASKGAPLLVKDAMTDPRLTMIQDSGIRVLDLVAVPLNVRNEVLGVIALVNKREDGPFSEADQGLLMAVADQAAVTLDLVRLNRIKAEQQRLEHELELARTFQGLLLPRKTPVYPAISMAAFYRSALEVGGDYYDFIELDDDHVGIAVGDVSGKGIPGALVMASVRASLRAEARLRLSPKEVLTRVNEQAFQDTQENVFITMTYGVLNTRTGQFRFCRAGHEPVLCCQNEGGLVASHVPEGIALGIISGELFNVTEEKELDLSREKLVVLYTDGVVEARSRDAEEYGEKRFHQVLAKNSGLPPASVVEKVVGDIERFTQGLPQHDDITLVVLGWNSEQQTAADDDVELKQNTA